MDKETLSNYGWIVICTLVLAIMIALATPFGEYVANNVQNTTQGFKDVMDKNLNIIKLGKEEPRSLISIKDFERYSSTPSNYQFLFFKDDYLRFYQIAAKGVNSCEMQIKSCPIELEMDKTYRLSFDIDDYYFNKQSIYIDDGDHYFLRCIIRIKDANGNATTKTLTIKDNGHYETEFHCNTPITIEYIRFGSNVYNNMEYRADISHLKLVEIDELEDTSSEEFIGGGLVDNTGTFGNPISIEDFERYSSSLANYQFMFFKDDYLRFYQGAYSNLNNCKMQIKSCPIELEMDKTYRLSFDIDDYYFNKQSAYMNDSDYYFLQCTICIKDANGNATTKTITIKDNGHYETEFYCNTPSTVEYIHFGDNAYNNMEYRADISHLKLVEIDELEDASSEEFIGGGLVDNTGTFGNPISIEDFERYSSSLANYQFMFFKDDYLRFYQGSYSNLYGCKMRIKSCPIELEMDKTYRLSFDIDDYYFNKQNSYINDGDYYFLQCTICIKDANGNATTKTITIKDNGHYETEFYCNTPSKIEYIYFGSNSYSYMEYRADISNFQLVEIGETNNNVYSGTSFNDRVNSFDMTTSPISIKDFERYSSSLADYQFMSFNDDYLRFYQGSYSNLYGCKMRIKSCPIELEMDKTYRLSFDIDDYYFNKQNSYINDGDHYFLQCVIYIKDANGNATTKTLTVKSNGHYETEFYCNTPSKIEYIYFGSNSYSYMEYRADISNFQLVEVK